VISAYTGDEGLSLSSAHKPDLIVLDVFMPRLDGWAVLSRLKADAHLCDIPVVMLSASDDLQRGIALGAADYLIKPVSPRDMLVAVSRYIPASMEKGRCKKVLLIDDDILVRQPMARVFRDAGWASYEAANGREGLQVLATTQPDIIFLDLIMPEMDGFEFIEAIREVPAYQRIPTIVLTSKDLTEDERTLLMNNKTALVLEKSTVPLDSLISEIDQYLQSTSF
jgi:CheY-like chemotaxis protein